MIFRNLVFGVVFLRTFVLKVCKFALRRCALMLRSQHQLTRRGLAIAALAARTSEGLRQATAGNIFVPIVLKRSTEQADLE